MRAEILGLAAGFEVDLVRHPGGGWEPPAEVTITLRPCWMKPPVQMTVGYLFTNEEARVAVYARKENQ